MGDYQSFISAVIYSSLLLGPLLGFCIGAYNFPFLAIGYFVWMMNDKAAFRKGRTSTWFRRSRLWVHFRDYFPCQLIFDNLEELRKHKQLLYASSPHGIIATSTHINFGTEANNISKYLPPITPVTLSFNFFVPFVREFFMFCGYQSCSQKTCDYILSRGKSLMIVIGGAQEVYYINKTHYRLIVKKRKGFFRLAFKYGIPVVPVFSFGENSIFTYINSPYLETIQQFVKKHLGFVPPLFHGLKYKSYGWSFIPHKEPLTTIIGNPIPVEKLQNPTQQDIEQLQQLYIAELERIFSKYRNLYGPCIKQLTVE